MMKCGNFSLILVVFVLLPWPQLYAQTKPQGEPYLFQQITIPELFRTQTHGLDYSGEARIDDLTGNGQVELIV